MHQTWSLLIFISVAQALSLSSVHGNSNLGINNYDCSKSNQNCLERRHDEKETSKNANYNFKETNLTEADVNNMLKKLRDNTKYTNAIKSPQGAGELKSAMQPEDNFIESSNESESNVPEALTKEEIIRAGKEVYDKVEEPSYSKEKEPSYDNKEEPSKPEHDEKKPSHDESSESEDSPKSKRDIIGAKLEIGPIEGFMKFDDLKLKLGTGLMKARLGMDETSDIGANAEVGPIGARMEMGDHTGFNVGTGVIGADANIGKETYVGGRVDPMGAKVRAQGIAETGLTSSQMKGKVGLGI